MHTRIIYKTQYVKVTRKDHAMLFWFQFCWGETDVRIEKPTDIATVRNYIVKKKVHLHKVTGSSQLAERDLAFNFKIHTRLLPIKCLTLAFSHPVTHT